MIDIKAIEARNESRKFEHSDAHPDKCYEGGHEDCLGTEDIDMLLVEVKRLRQIMPTTSADGNFTSGEVVIA